MWAQPVAARIAGAAADEVVGRAGAREQCAPAAVAARQRYAGRRLVACFQPHTYSRSTYLLDAFRTCFEGLDALYVLRTYEARESSDKGMDAQALAAEIERPAAQYVDSFEGATDRIAADLRPGDVCFTLGAGDITTLGPMLLDRLGGQR